MGGVLFVDRSGGDLDLVLFLYLFYFMVGFLFRLLRGVFS